MEESARKAHAHRNDQTRRLLLIEGGDASASRGLNEIRVLIACGDVLARAGLHALLEVEPDMTVAGTAADAEQAVALAREISPDVLLVDATLPDGDPLEVARQMAADAGTAAISLLILSASEDDQEVFASLRAGASGFLLRDTDPADLIHGVRAVAEGEIALSPSVMRRVIAELASQRDPGLPGPEQLDELTPRELEVMALVATGLSNVDIAEHLVISRATAKTHVSRVLRKLHARDRAQLVTLAYETGLVLPKQAALATA
jgi:DNA-binding NarL/FixJ family response regulator